MTASLPWALSGVCALALVGTLVASARDSTTGRYTAKPLASLAFILVAVTGGAVAADAPAYSLFVVAGLVLGAVGDVALMLPGRRPFLMGLVAFLLGHIAYILAFAAVTPVSAWFGPLALVPVVVVVPVTRWLWPHLDAMRIPVMAYVLVITTMVVAALAVLGDDGRVSVHGFDDLDGFGDRRAVLACAGAVLFFISDLAVARERFVTRSPMNRLWGLPTYYAGQLLFAWSALPG